MAKLPASRVGELRWRPRWSLRSVVELGEVDLAVGELLIRLAQDLLGLQLRHAAQEVAGPPRRVLLGEILVLGEACRTSSGVPRPWDGSSGSQSTMKSSGLAVEDERHLALLLVGLAMLLGQLGHFLA